MERPVPRGVSRGARDGSSLRRRDRATNPIVVPCAGGDSFRPAFAPSIAPLPAGLRHRMKVRCAIDVSPTTCLSRREQADLPAGHSLSRTGTRGQQAPLCAIFSLAPIADFGEETEVGRRGVAAARDRQGQSDHDGVDRGSLSTGSGTIRRTIGLLAKARDLGSLLPQFCPSARWFTRFSPGRAGGQIQGSPPAGVDVTGAMDSHPARQGFSRSPYREDQNLDPSSPGRRTVGSIWSRQG
jgi:hypothetical protein